MNNELNKWLAEKVMGWYQETSANNNYVWCNSKGKIMEALRTWNPSENIEQAFGCLNTFEVWEISKLNPGYMVLIDPYDDNDNWTKAMDQSLLISISLASAKAKGYEAKR